MKSPYRDYALIGGVSFLLLISLTVSGVEPMLWVGAILGSLPTLLSALTSLYKRKVTIDTFNTFALTVSFATGEIRSAAFIVLMLAFASLLDWYTESRTQNAVGALLALRPHTALRAKNDDTYEEIAVTAIRRGDELLVKEGELIPADGILIFGNVSVNEASVTGESIPVRKEVGDQLLGGTMLQTGVAKIRTTRVGEDSTLERMAALIKKAEENKSRSERLADRFAAIFLPIVILAGIVTYALTRNLTMTAALFLVACADDMAVAVPLAVVAALGRAAKRGVIVKGGEWLTELSRIQTLVLDKTGTLTYGEFSLRHAEIEPDIDEHTFWRSIGITEKFSEHPIGRTIFKEALKKAAPLPDPDEIKIYKGDGIWARTGEMEIVLGDESIFDELAIPLQPTALQKLAEFRERFPGTSVLVAINKRFAGFVSVADAPRSEAAASMAELRSLGIVNIVMFTGDNERIAGRVARQLGIRSYTASMSPEDKLSALEKLAPKGPLAMVGDGINDAPALARANVGIAMGSGGAAVAVETANIVILTDNLKRIPEMIRLGRSMVSVINWDMAIWVLSNAVGFALVLTGVAGPALAAFYNFATDFLPLINSSRLFRSGGT